MSFITERLYRELMQLGDSLDALLSHAQKTLPPDRFRVLHGTSQKMIATYERLGSQFGYFITQYERLSKPPAGPRPPGTLHRLDLRKKPRKR